MKRWMCVIAAIMAFYAVAFPGTESGGRAAYLEGANGDKSAVDKAIEIFEGLFAETEDPWHEAMLGSSYILKARDAEDMMGKLNFVKKGMKWLDNAVSAESPTLWVFWERGLCSMNLPAIFGRRKDAVSDLRHCLAASKRPTARDLELVSLYMGEDGTMREAENMFRYRYATALASGGGQKDAIRILSKIDEDSAFYERAAELAKELKKK